MPDLNYSIDTNNISFIDLFAGVGGIRIALERVGAKCVFSSEWDQHCQDIYELNFGDRPAGDITKISADDIPDHNILTAGFPCQAFSIIGDRLGFADTRGTLFFDIERILEAKRPYAFLLENVRQLVSHDHGRTFKVILEKLHRLGYFVHWKVLNGLDFGVPQKRDRVIIIGFLRNHPFIFPTKGLHPAKSLSDVLEDDDNVDDKYFISDHIKSKLQKKVKDPPAYVSVWHENKSGNIGIHPFSCALRSNASHNYLLVNGKRRFTPREMFRLQGYPESFKIVDNGTRAKRQAGNSVVVPKIEAVAKALLEAIKKDALPVVEQTSFSLNERSNNKNESYVQKIRA